MFRWRMYPAVPVIGILLASVFIVFQAYGQITSARLWAEEANVYLQQAVDSSNSWSTFWEPALGYYSLISRLVAFALARMPVAWVGAASMVFSLTLLFGLWCVIARQRQNDLALWLFAPISALLANGELLANSLLLSYWYAAGMCLLLMSEPDTRTTTVRAKLPLMAVLMLSALSGPHALFILPVAALIHASQKQFRLWLQQWWVRTYGLMAFCQAIFIVFSLLNGSFQTDAAQGGHRFVGLTVTGVLQSLVKYNLVYPIFGYNLLEVAKLFQIVAIILVLAGWLYLLWSGSRQLRYLVAAALALQALYLVASIGGIGGPRYAFTVNVLLLGALAIEAFRSTNRISARAVACTMLFIACLSPLFDQDDRITKFAKAQWPSYAESLNQACSAIEQGDESPCLHAWPGDDPAWTFCPKLEQLRQTCVVR